MTENPSSLLHDNWGEVRPATDAELEQAHSRLVRRRVQTAFCAILLAGSLTLLWLQRPSGAPQEACRGLVMADCGQR